MLAPRYPAAVVAGNVETSQAVTGALYAALQAQAEGSGTMNNLTFGNDRYQYYETVASGSGAGPDFHGTSVVQTHMLSGAARGLRDPARQQRRRAVSRRLRRTAPATVPRTDDGDLAQQPSPNPALRHGRRGTRCTRSPVDRAGRWHHPADGWPGLRGGRGRRRVRDRDTRRRRVRLTIMNRPRLGTGTIRWRHCVRLHAANERGSTERERPSTAWFVSIAYTS